MRLSLFISLVSFLILFCQCGSHADTERDGLYYLKSPEMYDAIDSCMSFMDSDPALAHRMLDSLRDAGIVPSQRCEFLHATIVFEGENKLDSALMMCNRLLDDGEFGDDCFLEAQICGLATNIASKRGLYIEVLQYADRGIALCHDYEFMHSDEAEMMGRAGIAHQMLGQLNEARQTYDRALKLLHGDKSFDGLIALISLQKKQAGLYRETGDYDRMICVCHDILYRVERFDRDPSFVEPRPATMTTSSEATHGFADFYQTQMYACLARAYRMKVEQGVSIHPKADSDSAAYYVEKWTHTAGSHSPHNMVSAMPELYFTGRRAEFEAAKQVAASYFGSDTLVIGYIEYLKLMAQDAASRKDMKTCSDYLLRAVAVNDSIRQQDLLRTFSEQMSIHLVQEAQLAQLDAEYKLSRHWILTAFLGTGLLTCLVINVLVWVNRRRKRALEAVRHDLEETKEEVLALEQQLKEARAESPHDNMTALYRRIEREMIGKKLYLRPDLNIAILAEEIGSGRTNISVCINSVTGKPFRNWLSEYRLDLFVQMMKQYPDDSIEDLISRCGYQEQSTFRRQFKATYGMTAGEFRKRMLAKKKQLTVNSEQLTVNS